MATSNPAMKFAYLSVVAALATIALKVGAWWITGSVSLLSDAAESMVNLVAAIVAVIAIRAAARPADHNHHFGHSKAEYFSAAAEGLMIFVAACVIVYTAVERLLHPQELEQIGLGLVLSLIAAVLNAVVGLLLIRAGRALRSAALAADGHHLMTDVYTSVGVVLGVGLVAVTNIWWLDPLVALAVGVNIIFIGWKLIHSSVEGLMDIAWPASENRELATLIASFESEDVHFHALRTRMAGDKRFAEVHVLVPGEWTVRKGHDLSHDVAEAVAEQFAGAEMVCHLEPREDPRAYNDYATEIPLRE